MEKRLDDLDQLRARFGRLLKETHEGLPSEKIAPRTPSGKLAKPRLSNWEAGRHLPSTEKELLNHLERVKRANGGRPLPPAISSELLRLWREIGQVQRGLSANRRLARRRRPQLAAGGVPIREWNPTELGVHRSITVKEETGLTPFLSRAHDDRVCARLATARDSMRASLLVVVGGSCTGKTRSLYEAVTAELPDWGLVAPRDDSELAEWLAGGLPPARTVVWLDELQRYLTDLSEGVTATKALRKLLTDRRSTSLVVAGTIWPTNLEELRERPTAIAARTGAEQIRQLLDTVDSDTDLIEVPDGFTAKELPDDPTDRRLRLAIGVADTVPATDERQVIQVLAGGAQLVARLYTRRHGFTLAAKAVLLAAADLRRVGLLNPLPRWAIEGAAPGYLAASRGIQADWFKNALAEASDVNPNNRDIHSRGIPALTPNHQLGTSGQLALESYDIHDYLLADHLDRRRRNPISPSLWDTVTGSNSPRLDVETLERIARTAGDHGLIHQEIAVLRTLRNMTSLSIESDRILRRLGGLGDPLALTELRNSATDGDPVGLAQALGRLADWGNAEARAELEERSAAGDHATWTELRSLLVAEHGRPGLKMAATADQPEGLQVYSPVRSRADHFYNVGDVDSLERLRAVWSDNYIGRRLARLLIELDRIDALRIWSGRSQNAANYLIEYEDAEALDDEALRAAAARQETAARVLALRLFRRGEASDLALMADRGVRGIRTVLVRVNAASGQVNELRQCVHASYGPVARDSLRALYQAESGQNGPVALDTQARQISRA